MAGGATGGGDEMVVGRTNTSEVRTLLIATNGNPDGYDDDFVLNVSSDGDKLLVSTSHGVDAVHAKGTVAFPTGGAIGTIPAGNGVVSQGLNGAVGYVHEAPRDKNLENSVVAGVLGVGAAMSPGVFGKGQNGVVGYEQSIGGRNLAFEAAEMAGVLGVGQIGVSGDGANGPGVHGRGLPGVRGECTLGGPGVVGEGQTGVFAIGADGPGVQASSASEQAAVFQSSKMAQLWLVPIPMANPSALAMSNAGEILVTRVKDPRGTVIASLWFCTSSRPGGFPTWVKLA